MKHSNSDSNNSGGCVVLSMEVIAMSVLDKPALHTQNQKTPKSDSLNNTPLNPNLRGRSDSLTISSPGGHSASSMLFTPRSVVHMSLSPTTESVFNLENKNAIFRKDRFRGHAGLHMSPWQKEMANEILNVATTFDSKAFFEHEVRKLPDLKHPFDVLTPRDPIRCASRVPIVRTGFSSATPNTRRTFCVFCFMMHVVGCALILVGLQMEKMEHLFQHVGIGSALMFTASLIETARLMRGYLRLILCRFLVYYISFQLCLVSISFSIALHRAGAEASTAALICISNAYVFIVSGACLDAMPYSTKLRIFCLMRFVVYFLVLCALSKYSINARFSEALATELDLGVTQLTLLTSLLSSLWSSIFFFFGYTLSMLVQNFEFMTLGKSALRVATRSIEPPENTKDIAKFPVITLLVVMHVPIPENHTAETVRSFYEEHVIEVVTGIVGQYDPDAIIRTFMEVHDDATMITLTRENCIDVIIPGRLTLCPSKQYVVEIPKSLENNVFYGIIYVVMIACNISYLVTLYQPHPIREGLFGVSAFFQTIIQLFYMCKQYRGYLFQVFKCFSFYYLAMQCMVYTSSFSLAVYEAGGPLWLCVSTATAVPITVIFSLLTLDASDLPSKRKAARIANAAIFTGVFSLLVKFSDMAEDVNVARNLSINFYFFHATFRAMMVTSALALVACYLNYALGMRRGYEFMYIIFPVRAVPLHNVAPPITHTPNTRAHHHHQHDLPTSPAMFLLDANSVSSKNSSRSATPLFERIECKSSKEGRDDEDDDEMDTFQQSLETLVEECQEVPSLTLSAQVRENGLTLTESVMQ
eukprot:PhF_6_TR44213/c3_g1_i3/m.67907